MTDGDNDRFRGRMLECIKRKGSLYSLSKSTGIAVNTLRRYTKGSEPSRPNLVSIAIATNTSVTWLATGEGEEWTSPGRKVVSLEPQDGEQCESVRLLALRFGGLGRLAEISGLPEQTLREIVTGRPPDEKEKQTLTETTLVFPSWISGKTADFEKEIREFQNSELDKDPPDLRLVNIPVIRHAEQNIRGKWTLTFDPQTLVLPFRHIQDGIRGANIRGLALFRSKSYEMAPFFHNGESAIVDISDREVREGAALVRIGSTICFRRVILAGAKRVVFSSVIPSPSDDIVNQCNRSELGEDFEILGRPIITLTYFEASKERPKGPPPAKNAAS